MRTVNTVNWDVLLNGKNDRLMKNWGNGLVSTRYVTEQLAHTSAAGEFRKLVRNNGTTYGRRLARKALRYRGILV